MRRGSWHQFGDRSHKLALEQLKQGVGVGVIISPRDLTRDKAIEYAKAYHDLDKSVLIDQQFYEPDFSNKHLTSYLMTPYRKKIAELKPLSAQDLDGLSNELTIIHNDLSADGIIAPALVYEASRPDILMLNAKLFASAKKAGDILGRPTYATVILGKSVTAADTVIDTILSQVTALDSDGWYYGFEFEHERVPSNHDAVLRCCKAGLTLACTGKHVLHAFAGPLALLSLGFGATGAAVGHSQNLWKFSHSRWRPNSGQGGGGDAPPRFFSRSLWGTIIFPDELAKLPSHLQTQVLTHSVYSTAVGSTPPGPWDRWSANKHLVNIICSTVDKIAAYADTRASTNEAIAILQGAVALHGQITATGRILRDSSNVYQNNWLTAIQELLRNSARDFDYLAMLK